MLSTIGVKFTRRSVFASAGGSPAETPAQHRGRQVGIRNRRLLPRARRRERQRLCLVPGGRAFITITGRCLVDTVVSRGEFLTSYTPYQAEIAQGTLITIFEFQTMICQLTGMEVANASMYDGSSAVPEAAMMAMRLTHRDEILVSRAGSSRISRSACHLRAASGHACGRSSGYDPESGRLDLDDLEKQTQRQGRRR